MSADKIEKESKNLMAQARGSTDPESLWQIAARLDDLGQTDKAATVKGWAHAAEAARDRAQAVRA
jgi:hypothetical protein